MKLYRLLLNLYPARFREEYGGPLEQQFLHEYREAQMTGGRFKLWLTALRDLAWSIPIELAHELRQDLAHSLRVHARRPFVMTFTIAILALAIGGATGVFSVVNAVLIKSLPFRDPDRLVVLSGFNSMVDRTPAEFHKWRSSSSYLEDAVQAFTAEVNVGGLSVPTRVIVAQTSFNFFSALGSEPLIGRAFAPLEDVPGNDGIAVISHSLWQQLYGSDPRLLGSKILLNGVPLIIVGVAQPGFDYPHKSSVWTPTAFDLARLPNKGAGWYPFGRLKKGVSLRQAQQMFEADAAHIAPPSWLKAFSPKPNLIPLRTDLAEDIREPSLILMAAVGFVLLIACGNVANLLLTRTTERREELAIRAALGASRARLVQQLLSESVLLSFIAAVVGLAVAYWAAKLATLTQPPGLASQEYTILDWRVFGFAIGIAIVTGLLFGVTPALLVRHLQPTGELGRITPVRGSARLRGVLIAMQVALTLVLLAGSVTMGRSFLHLTETDMGFRTNHLISVSVSLAGTGEHSEDRKLAYYRSALDRLRAVPGVESAAAAYSLPVDTMFGVSTLVTESGRETSPLLNNRVTPDYFRTMGVRLVYGREFTAADTGRVAMLSEGAAREVAEGPSVLGRKITPEGGKESFTVVGVVHAARFAGPEQDVMEQYFLPAYQEPPDYATFVARVHDDAKDSLAACRDAVQSADHEVPVYNVKTLQQRFEETLARPRFRTTIFLFFGGFALLLAIAGIYGVSSYSITQRRREIGVRIAIGASARGVRAMVLRQALWPIGAGMVIGLVGAAWQGRLLEHLLPAAPPVDVPASAAAAVVLAFVAIFAIWSATRRILELNPIEVLKSE
jgi:putative ABC transport system permease protein